RWRSGGEPWEGGEAERDAAEAGSGAVGGGAEGARGRWESKKPRVGGPEEVGGGLSGVGWRQGNGGS
ncbi:hypothetical protein CYMTET_33200, partial [Cymbomonas tetramitiformis]